MTIYKSSPFPFLIHEIECLDADVINCSSCDSVYRFSYKMASGPVASLLYCRFTNTIYSVNYWAEMNPEFKAEMDKIEHYAGKIIFSPTRGGKPSYSSLEELANAHDEIFSGQREAPRPIQNCPYCGMVIPRENWKTVKGMSKIPWIDLATRFKHTETKRPWWKKFLP